jgi:succinate dehydrogenase/fumarate reductase flavoprotein subunit
MSSVNLVETDVLVIGGGMAGLFAAIKSAKQGVRVTLVDKGYAGKSGSSPYAYWFAVFNPTWGHNLNAWMEHVNTIGEYVNNREWTEIVFKDSYDRFQDLISWGVEFQKDEKGEFKVGRFPGIDTQSLQLKKRVFGQVIRKQAVKSGVKIVDRVMVTDLIKTDGQITGAAGMAADSYDLHVFQAKAIVMCSGGSSFRPPGWPVSELTGDGDMMAFRAGAVISGKEFNEIKSTNANYPAVTMGMSLWLAEEGKAGAVQNVGTGGAPQLQRIRGINSEGKEVLGLVGSNFMELEFEAHSGKAPLYSAIGPAMSNVRTGGSAAGLSVHTSEGIWPVNDQCATNLPGLYAAGDSCCTMHCGAVYPGVGYAIVGAAVTGARAGLAASEYVRQVGTLKVDEQQIAGLKKAILEPAERKGGFGPRWVTQVLQNTMIPYFILYVKKGDRLQSALTIVEFMKDHLVPNLFARNPHELRLVHETKNMVHNAEAKLRASLFRTESRGTHFREDFPHRQDPDWLAWVMLKEESGEMKLFKKQVPREWWPNMDRPYPERYPNRFPGE